MSLVRSGFVVAVLAVFAVGFLVAGCQSEKGMNDHDMMSSPHTHGDMGMAGDVTYQCSGCGKTVTLDADQMAPSCCGHTMMKKN